MELNSVPFIKRFFPSRPAAPVVINDENNVYSLTVKDLHKKFGLKEVVRGVNFTMHNGEVAGLLGPNGAGKTTIFYMIVGFYKPTQGIVTMNEVDITP